jgi:hypothetical protein
MASQMNLGIDDPGKNVLSSQVDPPFTVRQESIAADRDNLAIRNCNASFDDPPGVTTKPLLTMRSAMSLAIRYSPFDLG